MSPSESNSSSGQRHFGLYPALVTGLVDPEGLGRVQVRFPWLGRTGDGEVRAWATLLSPYADADQGLLVLPEVGSQVVVGFEAGDLRRPYVVGCAWNGKAPPPVAPEEANNLRTLKTRSGSTLEFDDTEGAAKVSLSTRAGHRLLLDEGTSEVQLIHASGMSITFTASGQIHIDANGPVEISAPALNVHAATATFDGAVNCTSLNASASICSPLYSQGAGNIW